MAKTSLEYTMDVSMIAEGFPTLDIAKTSRK